MVKKPINIHKQIRMDIYLFPSVFTVFWGLEFCVWVWVFFAEYYYIHNCL